MENKNPLVSVIVTTYNRKSYLKEALESILNQSFINFEVIVIDNFSNYNFYDFINSFNDNRIIAIQNHNNGIIAINRNLGISKSKGKYISFCDDDDIWLPDKLEKQIYAIEKANRGAVGIGGNVILFGEKTNYRKKRLNNQQLKFIDLFKRTISLSSLLIKNENYYFDERPDFCCVEDAAFQLNLLKDKKRFLITLADDLIRYRVHLKGGDRKLESRENFLNVIESYKNYLTDKQYNGIKSDYYYSLGIFTLKTLNRKRSYYFKKSLSSTSFSKYIIRLSLYFLSLLSNKILKLMLKIYYRN